MGWSTVRTIYNNFQASMWCAWVENWNWAPGPFITPTTILTSGYSYVRHKTFNIFVLISLRRRKRIRRLRHGCAKGFGVGSGENPGEMQQPESGERSPRPNLHKEPPAIFLRTHQADPPRHCTPPCPPPLLPSPSLLLNYLWIFISIIFINCVIFISTNDKSSPSFHLPFVA